MVPLVLVATLSATTSAFGSDTTPTNVVTIQSNFEYISSLATAPNGDIWVADWTLDQVKLLSKASSGTVSSLKTISVRPAAGQSINSNDASSIAVDSNGFLYVADATVNKIFVFDPTHGANQTLEDATRTIDLGHRARTIALDSSGQIYAAGRYNSRIEIRIFSAGTSAGSGVPIQTFTDSSTISTGEPYGLAIFPSGEVAVAQYSTADIRIFSSNASGPVNPIRTISGANTKLLSTYLFLATDTSGRLYAANYGKLDIQIFAPLADGDVAPMASIRNIPGIEPDEYGWGITLEKDSQIWVGNYQSLIHFNNPFAPAAQAPTVDPVAAAKAAEAARARAVEVAKTELKSVLSSGKPLTADQLIKADINGVTEKNIGLVNADIAKLPEADRSDIKQIEKVVLKFATVDKVAEGKSFYSADLVAVGLIPQDSKIKTSVLATLKKLPSSSLDSFEKIQAAIASVEKLYIDRKARLAAILAKRR
jgi:6-phosphogluconolactonase (cycloisomerase 2 family)